MRKVMFALPVAAVLAAAGVLVATLAGSLAVAAPETATPDGTTATAAGEAAPVGGWHETNGRPLPPKKSPVSPP